MTAQAERFRNHAAQNDRRCADWRAAWRNWIAAAIERAPKTAVASLAQRQAQAQPADERWRRWIREYRQNRYWPKDDAGPAPGAPAAASRKLSSPSLGSARLRPTTPPSLTCLKEERRHDPASSAH
ncbi:hypothetical protein PFY01_08765 [Brevundimonas vesicularis]|uniref:hypothetical protein n=1 Tax=Brevundimonas vesicularis TaxID=41276 RepID=UPI0022EC820F|nr:hypothetical protein [Brevundimonas vesicularis]WBT04834.1 hypothetical protein PFY01_08765 [Brevundimonas vesicularis]